MKKDRTIKVLMIANIPPDMASVKGGVESALLNLLVGLQHITNIILHVLSFRDDILSDYIQVFSENITFHFIHNKKTGLAGLFSIFVFERNIINDLYESLGCDLIHFQDSGPHLLALKGFDRSKVIITVHGVFKEERRYQVGLMSYLKFTFKALVDSQMLPTFRNFIFISEYNRRQLRKIICFSEIIPNPIHPKLFDLKACIERGNMNLIYTGAINRRKNLLFLLEVLCELRAEGKPMHLTVVGGSKESKYLNKVIDYIKNNDLSSSVDRLGWQTQTQVFEHLERSKAFVLPSLQESLPVSIIEAMAAGKVVIASDVGGICELIEQGKSGFLFPRNDKAKIKDILLKLYYDTDLQSAVSSSARKRAYETYLPEIVAKKTFEFYLKVLDRNTFNKN
ncbi:MAG: glycosyltransferase family 4 protein [Bacteroidales bacterium]|nr:glycosyltransferase family 4 protein [Bacteroidales bacterium]